MLLLKKMADPSKGPSSSLWLLGRKLSISFLICSIFLEKVEKQVRMDGFRLKCPVGLDGPF